MHRRYYVFILTNRVKTDWYVGITSDLSRWTEELHASVSRWNYFFKWFRCIHLVYYETFSNMGDAIGAQNEIKSWNDSMKKALIKRKNPDFSSIEV